MLLLIFHNDFPLFLFSRRSKATRRSSGAGDSIASVAVVKATTYIEDPHQEVNTTILQFPIDKAECTLN